ncbi:hypothetical protein ACFXDO_18805 [Streptomyces nigra]|uniref:hypothetical protein n=1 Tax=Streptomyces nigra TaxID=1827580 RepID=UPI0036AB20B1
MTHAADPSTTGPTAVAAAVRELGTVPDTYGPTLNTTTSPAAVALVGKALADILRPHRPTALAFWNTSDDAVLAYAVARQLDAALYRADDVQGIVAWTPATTADARVALLATVWSDATRLEALTAVTARHCAEVVAVASVFNSPVQQRSALPKAFLLEDDAPASGAQHPDGAART